MKRTFLENINKGISCDIFASVIFWNTLVDISAIWFVKYLKEQVKYSDT